MTSGIGQTEDTRSDDTLVVAAGAAWAFYLRHAAYVCQADRSFRASDYMAFYRRKRIEARVPSILDRRDHVLFTPETAAGLRLDGHPFDSHLADVIEDALREGSRHRSERYQVFLLQA